MATTIHALTIAAALTAAALHGAPQASLQSMIDAAKPGDTLDVPPGVYREKVLVPKDKRGISIRGGGKAVVTWDDFAGKKGPDGSDLGTFRSYTMKVERTT